DRRVGVVIVWACTVLAVLTVRGLGGQGFQLRYLAPALPALCLLAALGVLRFRNPIRWTLAGVLGAVTLATALRSTSLPDPFPFVVVDLARLTGIPVERWLSGMW
ncbi:MAG: hypothetical protein R3344_09835, partial [Acidobacteriota bacterium]|nr:hypothetical protein [Acidobacteriota bacterium]